MDLVLKTAKFKFLTVMFTFFIVLIWNIMTDVSKFDLSDYLLDFSRTQYL